MAVFRIQAIIPPKLKIEAIRKELLAELEAEGRDLVKDFEQTTATWQHEKPTFRIESGLRGNDAVVQVGPTGNAKGIAKWNWLDQGTRVRYALMSGDWQSKTRPGRLQSGGGRGRVIRVSKQIRRPGIKARGWSKHIQRQNKRRFPKRIRLAMQRGAKKLYG